MRVALAIAFAVLPSGCVLVAAGAGAGGGIYLTSRGAESIVTAPIARTYSAAERALQDTGVKQTGSKVEDEGKKRELKGEARDGDVEVIVELESKDPETTRVEVRARKSLVTWDKDYAKQVLEAIVKHAQE